MPSYPHRPTFDPEDYARLRNASRADLAWEWLRRDRDYQCLQPSSWSRGCNGCREFSLASAEVRSRWGCLNVVSPALGADAAEILWSDTVETSVLHVAALPAREAHQPAFDIAAWDGTITIIRGHLCEHVLMRSGWRRLRFDVCHGTIRDGPVCLFMDIARDCEAMIQTGAVRRLRNMLLDIDTGIVARQIDQAHLRQIAALKTFDVVAAGGSIRDVAINLFGEARVRAEWFAPGDSLKSTSRRLIALARDMSSGGYRNLLKPTSK